MDQYWSLLIDPPLPPAVNMAVDWWIMTRLSRPVLRFYQWANPAISLGYRQQDEFPDDLKELPGSYPLIVRPTGGGYLYHEGELSYSIALPKNHPISRQSIRESYSNLCEPMIRTVRSLGLIDCVERGGNTSANANCLARPAEHEPVVNGSKWMASAQVRFGGDLLQHGSLFWDGDWPDCLADTSPYFLKKSAESQVKMSSLVNRMVNRLAGRFFSGLPCRSLEMTSKQAKTIRIWTKYFAVDSRENLPVFDRSQKEFQHKKSPDPATA